MVEQIQFGQKNDPPGTPAAPYLHGAGGLLNVPGTDRRVVSAMSLPITGALANIPVVNGGLGSANEFGGEQLGLMNIFTGVTQGAAETFANQPTAACADGPEGGLKKMCTVANLPAHYKFSTRELDMERAGERATYADPTAMNVLNTPPADMGAFLPGLMPSLQQALGLEINDRIFEMLVSHIRFLARRVWIGTPANNNGKAKDLWGFDGQINVNTHLDFQTQNVCHAADSDVKNFGYANIAGSVRDIVEYIEMCDTYVDFNAMSQGLDPFEYDIYMHPNMWPTISQIWPIRQYQAFVMQVAAMNLRAGGVGGSFGDINLSDAQQLRTNFRNGMILPVNGKARRVILDSGITEQSPNNTPNLQPGQWASTIYGVPRTILGGIPATFFKFFNHNNNQEQAIAQLVSTREGNGPTFSSDGGVFRWYTNFKNGCLKMNVVLDPSLWLIAPQLAWRIDNVMYSPLQHLRSAFPDSDYFFDGGRTTGNTPTYYSGWSETRAGLA